MCFRCCICSPGEQAWAQERVWLWVTVSTLLNLPRITVCFCKLRIITTNSIQVLCCQNTSMTKNCQHIGAVGYKCLRR